MPPAANNTTPNQPPATTNTVNQPPGRTTAAIVPPITSNPPTQLPNLFNPGPSGNVFTQANSNPFNRPPSNNPLNFFSKPVDNGTKLFG